METLAPPAPLVLIDGHALAYRMYFALERSGMRSPDGQPTWAIYGFFNALFSLLQTQRPSAMAVSFDMAKETFRTRLFADYKGTRASMPDDLRAQMDGLYRGVQALGIPIYQQPDYEADDVIGTLSRQGLAQGLPVRILTGDQDAFQLIECVNGDDTSPINTQVLVPSRSPKEGLKAYDKVAVFEKWGVYPKQVIDFKALKGDTSDNIPGVPGIGDKTAAKLLAECITLDGVYANLSKAGSPKLQDKLLLYKEQAYLSQTLATIVRDVPDITLNVADCALHVPSKADWLAFCASCNFKQFAANVDTLLAPFTIAPSPLGSGQGEGTEGQDEGIITAPSPIERVQGDGSNPHLLQAVRSEDYQLIDTPEALQAWLAQVQTAGVFALDLETTGLDVLNTTIVGIAMAIGPGLSVVNKALPCPLKEPSPAVDEVTPTVAVALPDKPFEIQAVYIPLAQPSPIEPSPLGRGQGEGTSGLAPALVFTSLAPLLANPSLGKLIHNVKFDCNVLLSHGLPVSGLVLDTMIASYVVNPDRRHGLKVLGQDTFALEMPDISTLIGSGKKEISFAQVPVADAATYAARDARVTWALAAHLLHNLTEAQEVLLYTVELPMAHTLASIERTGVCLDTGYLAGLSRTLSEGIATLEDDMATLAGLPFNPNSPKQVADLLFVRLGIKPQGKTASKTSFSTDAKVLERLADQHPIIPKLLEYRQLFKLKSTYVDALPQLVNPTSGRLHTNYHQTVTATGRLSSASPNLQNIPVRSTLGRQIRQAFVPQHGWVMLSADYSQIELRLLAHFSQDPNLIEAFNEGADIHAATAAKVFGIPLDQVTKTQRDRAKTVNFGVVYGQSAHSLSDQLHITHAEAQQFIDQYFATYGKVKAYIAHVKATAHETGSVSTLLGHTRNLSADLNSRNRSIKEFAERAAFNTPLQGSASDLMKLAMIRLKNALAERPELRANVLLQVHDELVLECHPDDEVLVEALVRETMALGQPLSVPLVIDVYVGPSWMEG
jgi:DNA polymerase I